MAHLTHAPDTPDPMYSRRPTGDTCVRIKLDSGGQPVQGDFKVELLCKPKLLKPKEKLGWVWLNTFIEAGGAGPQRAAAGADRMERASSCPEEEAPPAGHAYPIVR